MIEVRDNGSALRLSRLVEKLSFACNDLSPLMHTIAGIMHDEVEENFAQQGRPKWMGLKAPVPKRRQGGMILQDTGQLAASIQQGANARSAWVGTNKVYAAIHQFGGTLHKGAQSRQVRHRTNAKGELLRSAHLGGKGLIFAKNSHKRAVARWFEQGAHSITMPARPFLGISLQGELKIVRAAGKYLASVIP